jgi:hypothetical protein
MSIPKISYPENECYLLTHELVKFCKENNLSYKSVITSIIAEVDMETSAFTIIKDIFEDPETALSKVILLILKR